MTEQEVRQIVREELERRDEQDREESRRYHEAAQKLYQELVNTPEAQAIPTLQEEIRQIAGEVFEERTREGLEAQIRRIVSEVLQRASL